MEWAHRLALGSRVASKVYRSLEREKQVYTLFKELKSMAIRELKEGKCAAEVVGLLEEWVVPYGGTVRPKGKRYVWLGVVAQFGRQLFGVHGHMVKSQG
jgi:hypothetical protein